ncbi:MFS transporter [Paenibacillus sp. R14(2021)]|uniref:MFS transporter n=1 Tax=Paenibacillus sp. R14(2021) TaxID=2859228 RepID=UPI001C612E7D|nr:MFS transporter [Paenibacillus sp. R14(2021)]
MMQRIRFMYKEFLRESLWGDRSNTTLLFCSFFPGVRMRVWMIAIAVLLIGFSQGLFFPMSFNKMAQVVPKERLTTAISILLAGIYAFQFICPLFMHAVPALFSYSSTRETFLLLAIAEKHSCVFL